MDLIKQNPTVRGVKYLAQKPSDDDYSTAQMCFVTAAGLFVAAVFGWLAELVMGMGGNLSGLIIFSVGYLCCGLKQQASIWLANRAVAKERSLRQIPALAVGYLPHADILPPACESAGRRKQAQRSRFKSLSCI